MKTAPRFPFLLQGPNPAVLLTISLCGLVVGYVGMGAINKPVDRVSTFWAYFQTYCAPPSTGQSLYAEPGFLPLNLPGAPSWGDPKTGLVISRSKTRCAVEDSFSLFTPNEREKLKERILREIPRNFAHLKYESRISDEPKHILYTWTDYPNMDLRKTAVSYLSLQERDRWASSLVLVIPEDAAAPVCETSNAELQVTVCEQGGFTQIQIEPATF